MRKERKCTARLAQELHAHKPQYLLAAGIFLLGLLAGSFGAVRDTDASIQDYFQRFLSAYPLQGAARVEIFRLSLLNYAKLGLLLYLSGWAFWLLPLGALQVGIKGFRTGFTVACLLRCYRLRGALLAGLAILPQSILLIPTLCFYLVYQFQFAADRRYLRGAGRTSALKRQIYCHNLLMTLLFLGLLLLCALLESYVTPTLIQPICGLFR